MLYIFLWWYKTGGKRWTRSRVMVQYWLEKLGHHFLFSPSSHNANRQHQMYYLPPLQQLLGFYFIHSQITWTGNKGKLVTLLNWLRRSTWKFGDDGGGAQHPMQFFILLANNITFFSSGHVRLEILPIFVFSIHMYFYLFSWILVNKSQDQKQVVGK